LQKPLLTLKVNQNLIENFTLIVHVLLTGALAVYRERRKELPVLPKSRIEANEALKSINLNTNKDESFK
jgi:hypothetical protein